MRYQIVNKRGNVVMTAPDLSAAIKVLASLPDGYQIEPITKTEHREQFNRGADNES